MKLNKYNLKIIDKSLNKKYKISQKKSMIILARIYFVFLLFMFFLYTITDFLVNGDEVAGYYKLGIIMFFFMCFSFTFTDYYQHIYQNFLLSVICLAIFVKIVLDWMSMSFILILNTALVAFLSSCTLTVDVVKICMINLIHLISFCVRYIIESSKYNRIIYNRIILNLAEFIRILQNYIRIYLNSSEFIRIHQNYNRII